MGSLVEENFDLVVVGGEAAMFQPRNPVKSTLLTRKPGGPTGLLSAVLARQLGLSVAVIDEKPSALQLGRADALNARTQQYLEVVGILPELRAKGIECNTSSTFAEGVFQSRQNQWWTSLEHCQHKNFLMIGQPEVERALLGQLDTPVRFGERVTSVREDTLGVRVESSAGRVARCQFAIAADGARSMVRQELGIGFSGTKPEMIWAVLDTFLDTDFPLCSEIITFQLRGQSRVAWIPRERGMARFYVLLEGEITQERAEASIREHLAPYRVDFVRTEWFSTFEVRERIASEFITKAGKGRIVLAGDAAHVHSVNGGQGLNTGIADAFALVWRLALACRAGARADIGDLVSPYETERRAVAQDVIGVAARLVRDTLNTAEEYVATIQKNAGYITGMGVAYHDLGSSQVVESQRGMWKAGKRCPDIAMAPAAAAEASPQRLYSRARYGRFLILQVGQSNRIQLFGRFRDSADVFMLLAHGDATDSNGQGVDTSPTFASDQVAPGESFTVIVRPDMYIGYVGGQDGAAEYLDRLLIRAD